MKSWVLDTLSQVISANLTRAALEAAPVIADLSSWLADVAGKAGIAWERRGFDAKDFVMELRERPVTPHIAQNTSGRRSAIDGRTTRHEGYAHSQQARKRIEEAFGWIKTIAGQARTRLRGLERVRWSFTLAAAADNLIRLPKLIAATP
jgi:Transposase DDE domain